MHNEKFQSGNSKWLVVLALSAMLLAGCGKGGEADAFLVDYQRQLAEALGLEAPVPRKPNNIDTFPAQDERLLVIPEIREGLFNVYALRDCHITQLVAQRNNQLGRVASASQRWLYELELWHRLDTCGRSEVPQELSEANRQRLATLFEIKTKQLPRASWNALFDSSEWVSSFSRASSPLPVDDIAPKEDQLEALAYLRDVTLHQFDPDWQPDSSTLEGHLQTLQTRPYGAELLRTLLLAEQRLSEASILLEQALTEAETCNRLSSPLETLHETAEVDDLDEWLAQLEITAQAWLLAVDALFQAHIEGTPEVADYRRRWLSSQSPDAVFPAFSSARKHHDTLIETIVSQCR